MRNYLTTSWFVDTAPENLITIHHRDIAVTEDSRDGEEKRQNCATWARFEEGGKLVYGAEGVAQGVAASADVEISLLQDRERGIYVGTKTTLAELAAMPGAVGSLCECGFGMLQAGEHFKTLRSDAQR